ncbi:unnamed protein product [Cuscuta europaea]|uniref:Retrotransposon gag domain-containing protein n=1 Tax=Cuscuta europaea TaxID=41803 RepID=A0A9P0Z1I7_CUSEU|nr:unnamed protein product [Cuscuta europaea]
MVDDGKTVDTRHEPAGIVIDSMSPYFIQSGDKPGDVYVTTPLRDGNYGDWLDEMSNALYAKNKFGFVNGDIPMPKPDSPYLPYWQRANAMVKAWLNGSMEIELRQSVKFKTAREIWTDLEERFGKESAPRAYELRCSLSAVRQDNQSVSAYFSRLRRIWDEMASINTGPNCDCGKCSCNISKQINESKDRDRLYDFLMGLDDIYGQLKTQILATRPIPTLTAAYHLISESEQHRSIASARKPSVDGIAFQVQAKGEIDLNRRQNLRGNRSCSHCGKTNHTYEHCFELNGYPPNWSIKLKGNKQGEGRQQDIRGNKEQPSFQLRGSNQIHPRPRFTNFERGNPRQTRAAHVDYAIPPGLSAEQLEQIAQYIKTEIIEKPSSSSAQANMAGLTLEEADWSG